MDEYIYQVRRYLPIRFLDTDANDFLRYLEDAYLINTEKEKYQFSFSAFHMLYMVFVYKVKWFLRQEGNIKIIQSIDEYLAANRRVVINSLFDLSQMPEKASVEELLKALSFHVNEVGICKRHVDIRNNCLHSSGKIYYKKVSQISTYIEEEIEYIQKIQDKIKPHLLNLLEVFINDNWDKPVEIAEWISTNYLSEKDLELLTLADLTFFKEESNTPEVIFKKILAIVFISEAQKFIEVDNSIIIDRLRLFLNGLPQEVEFSKDGDEPKTIQTQELIENHLIPIISKFDPQNREKAEKILNYS